MLLEAPCWDTANEYPWHVFSSRNNQNIHTFGWKKCLIKSYAYHINSIYWDTSLQYLTPNFILLLWMVLKTVGCMANSVDPDQSLYILQLLISWSTLFAQVCLSQYLGLTNG